MPTARIINGAQPYPFARGSLNAAVARFDARLATHLTEGDHAAA